MGFIDNFKRWRLTQKGMSSGAKRRTQSESSVVGAVNNSPFSRAGLYLLFTIAMIILVLTSTTASPFEADKITAALFASLFSFVAVSIYELTHKDQSKSRDVMLVFGGIFIHVVLIQLISKIPEGKFFDQQVLLLMLPYAFAPMIHSVLLGRYLGVFSTIMCSLFGCLMVPSDRVLYFFVISLVVGIVMVLLTLKVRRRGSLLRAGLYSGISVMIMGLFFKFLNFANMNLASIDAWGDIGIKFLAAISCSVIIAMVISGILPMLESAFALTTDISWLELSDLNHKLLKRMQLEAPGTFHHSLVLASLAEAAAESVGANAAMCRVCAYFHDIGKLKKPEYFIENQGDENPHDSLTPTMSALIIIAHVKDGIDLAIKHKLNPKIIKVIQEHHGDSLVYYFYRKAQEKRGSDKLKCDKQLENPEDVTQVDEKNFRYPGPTPSSKESGIISLADAIESASRSLTKPTPAKIQALVDDIVRNRMRDGQLDNCDLTMRDLAKIRESFAKTLRSMLHSRIDYPKEDNDQSPTRGGKLTPSPEDKKPIKKVEREDPKNRIKLA